MRKYLRELGLKEGPRIPELIALAAAAQERRFEHSDSAKKSSTEKLTRTTALYAAGELDPGGVRVVLEKAGLSWTSLLTLIGLEDRPEPQSVKDVDMQPVLRRAIRELKDETPGLEVFDLPELARAILGSVARHPSSGTLPKRLDELGLDVEAARQGLGSLQPPGKPPAVPLVYLSYNHKDKRWKDRLLGHLEPYVAEGLLEVWHDGLLKTGDDWAAVIRRVRERASAAILLISPNFLASETIRSDDLPHLLERRKSEDLRLLPLVVEPSPWQEVEWLKSIHLSPPGGRGLLLDTEEDQKRHLAAFAAEVARLAGREVDVEPPPPPPYREEGVPTHLDDPSRVDQLNRRPFAEVMALRIAELWQLESPPAAEESARGRPAPGRPAPGRPKRAGEKEGGRSFALHIHGPWGSGKTSVLNFMREQLQSGELGDAWVVVDFNAWRQQRIKPPWWSLIRQVYRQGREQLEEMKDHRNASRLRRRWFLWRLKADWLPVILAAFAIALIVFLVGGIVDLFGGAEGPAGASGNGAKPIDWSGHLKTGLGILTTLLAAWAAVLALGRSLLFGSARAAESYMELSRDPMGPITRLFEQLIRGMGHPVAIFIDDLDRCDGDYVVDLLEGVQTLFRRADATYVVAADRNWIRASFEQRYEGFVDSIAEPGRPLGYLFLEKLFQLSASVPRISPTARESFWLHLLKSGRSTAPAEVEKVARETEREAERLLGEAVTPEEMKRVIDHYQEEPIKQQGLRAAAAKRMSSAAARKRTEHFLQPFAGLLEPNPRAMKRLVNAFGIHQAVNFLEAREVDVRALALWTIVELRWPLLADCLSEHPALVSKVGQKTPPKDARIPEDLRDLFTAETVKNVVDGHGVDAARLDRNAIRSIVGLSPVEGSGGIR